MEAIAGETLGQKQTKLQKSITSNEDNLKRVELA